MFSHLPNVFATQAISSSYWDIAVKERGPRDEGEEKRRAKKRGGEGERWRAMAREMQEKERAMQNRRKYVCRKGGNRIRFDKREYTGRTNVFHINSPTHLDADLSTYIHTHCKYTYLFLYCVRA